MKKLTILLLIILFVLSCTGCTKQNKNASIAVISDLHYASNAYYLYDGDYAKSNDESGTGKQMKYLDDIFDAFIYQLKENPTDYLVISGDITFVGAKGSHLELAKKLSEIEANGTEVLVIPGNHDIVENPFDAKDGTLVLCEGITPDDFKEIYKDFGYSGEISYDEESLSYVVDTKKGVRIFMLDTNLYYGLIYGKLKDSTLNWLDEQLAACQKSKDTPIIVGHHNLFVHNASFTLGYQIGNHSDIEQLMSKYNVDLFLSGHLHPQHITTENNITEVASGSFAVTPHHYGIINVDNDGWIYNCYNTDVEGYAKTMNLKDENLLNYNSYGYNFFYKNAIRDGRLDGIEADEDTKAKIYDYASQVNVQFFAGELSKVDRTNEDLFKQYTQGTFWGPYVNTIMENPIDFVYATNKK